MKTSMPEFFVRLLQVLVLLVFFQLLEDVYLDEIGDYYIVIDGHNEADSGDFTVTIGEMLAFSDYEIGYQNDIVEYVQVSF